MLDFFISTVLVHYTEKGKCEQTLEKVSDAVTCLCSSSWKIIEVESFKIRLSLLARLCESFFPLLSPPGKCILGICCEIMKPEMCW